MLSCFIISPEYFDWPGQRQTSMESTRSLALDRGEVIKEGSRSKGKLSSLPMFDASIISAATHNFSPSQKLGEGGFGTVFKVLCSFFIKVYLFFFIFSFNYSFGSFLENKLPRVRILLTRKLQHECLHKLYKGVQTYHLWIVTFWNNRGNWKEEIK